MRITNKVIKEDYLNNLSSNLQNMQTLENQLDTGHQVSKPSDDPFKATRTMELLSDITANERYKTNIEEGIGWLSTTDAALGQMGDVLQTIREKTVAAGNGTYSDGEKKAIQDHLKQLKAQLMQIGNTSYDGRYIFGGDKTTDAPFDEVAGKVTYNGSVIGLNREMSQGVIMDVATKGSSFSDAVADPNPKKSRSGIFNTIDKIINALEPGATDKATDYIGDLDKEVDNVLSLRSGEGAQYKRLEDMSDKNDSETFNMTDLLSKTYDIDVAKKYMEFKVMESVYQASLMIGPKILQPSMLDYMR